MPVRTDRFSSCRVSSAATAPTRLPEEPCPVDRLLLDLLDQVEMLREQRFGVIEAPGAVELEGCLDVDLQRMAVLFDQLGLDGDRCERAARSVRNAVGPAHRARRASNAGLRSSSLMRLALDRTASISRAESRSQTDLTPRVLPDCEGPSDHDRALLASRAKD